MQFELGVTKDGLKETRNRMAQTAPAHSSSKEFLRQYADTMDGLVRKAFRNAQSKIPSPSVCLVAVGGYGRAELAPCSDVDLLLLYSPSDKADLPPLVEQTLYPLWDLGLEVSCSSRLIPECLKMAQSNLHVKTGLIDARYLDGEYEYFRTLYGLFTKRVLHQKVLEFAAALMKDLYLRHHRYQDPVYVLEPNIKEGEGGLRDFQIGRWAVRAKYHSDRWDSILFPDQSRMLERSIEFLWAVRNELHLLTERRQDILTFELQERVAPALGFPGGTKGVEEMMRQYHLSTQRILNFVTGLLDRILSEPSLSQKALFFFKRGKLDDLFGISGGEIHLLDPVTFKRDPGQLMTLFRHCQTHRIEMDYRTEEAVTEALPFIDDAFRASETVNLAFLSILREGEALETILKKMHSLGFLSRYIPEFSEIEGKVHYDLYHVHPVDVHSILAVEELVNLRAGTYQKEYPLLTSLIKEIDKPEILFLTALLHDVGKGGEGDHSLIGAEIVVRIGGRMGLSPEEKELIHFLVRHHLFMLETAFRRDLHDEQTILRFADEIKDPIRLKMVYLLTFADIRAVGPEAWTSWKDSLLMELFLRTSHFFESSDGTEQLKKEEGVEKMLSKLLPPEKVSLYAEHLPARYLACFSYEEIAHHLEMAHSLSRQPLAVEWDIGKKGQAKVTVCTKDRYGLFFKIAGSMFVNRLNILEAQIHTWANGIALDTFSVEEATREIEPRLQRFQKDLESVLSGAIALKDLLAQRKESNGIQKKVVPRVPAEVKINNHDSDFYTIIEVAGEDRLGILYEITQALTDHGCNIHFSRISTLGNRIVDVFYVQDTWGEKIDGKDRIERLRQTLLHRLSSGE